MSNVVLRIGSGNETEPWVCPKIVDPLLQILNRGAKPKQLAFSAALGITLGVFPICGVTVLLCGLVIAMLGSFCHAPTVMLANFIATPIELSLMIPFLRLGEFVTGGPHFPLTSDALKKVLTGQASLEVLQSIFNALLGWVVAVPVILAGLYILFLPCFNLLICKFGTTSLSTQKSLSKERILKCVEFIDERSLLKWSSKGTSGSSIITQSSIGVGGRSMLNS